MQLRSARRWAMIVLVCGVGASSATAQASLGSVLGFPFRWLGGQFFGGGVDKLKGAADKTLLALDETVTRHEERIGGLAQDLLSDAKGKVDDTVNRLDHSLEARILQIKTSADDSVDRALGQVDTTLKRNLARLEGVGTRLISDTGKELRRSLDHADELLRRRTIDLERVGNDLLNHADELLEARLAQLDEVATRQLGNVDVIATKQRIALERSAIQVLVIGGIIVFVVFVLKRMYDAYAQLQKRSALAGVRGAERTALLARNLGATLPGPLLAGLAGVLLLVALQRWLPLGAVHEARDLVQLHLGELEASAARFDYAAARFHASHILYLDPAGAPAALARAEKVGLLRDVAYRPTLLATESGVLAFERRLQAVESGLGPLPDADVLVMHALLRWRTGATRADEHVAASLAARALRLAPRGFALAPLARSCVAAFLATPYVPDQPALGRDSAGLDQLRDTLAATPVDPPASPLAPALELADMMRELEHTTSVHYVAMVTAHARAVARRRVGAAHDTSLAQLLAERQQHAQAISDAWTAFDHRLQSASALAGRPALEIFHLNDALLTRARWVLAQPETLSTNQRLEEIAATPDSLQLRLDVAPARVAWARRYAALFAGPLKAVVEFEETERFRSWERWCLEFEQASIALEQARTAEAELDARWRVVVASSALALYVDSAQGPVAYAATVGGELSTEPPAALLARTPDAPRTLEEALLRRGPDLI